MLCIVVFWIFVCSNFFVNYLLIKYKGIVVNYVFWFILVIVMFSDDIMRNWE